ncbi:ABC transporter ATP-binding protein [Ornithobacterium rhinotracheale]|uniref:ABC-type antimicrobial peptide transport system, ATPase component n=1 Tax=Ornithobacterium rhinotracheale (strain ATCC 51463 / DSM 15997 / CCUG 23171 / CIP 104009 / LMG 9086) TaxID=867902 RepID=I4A1D5_ORNRL|nr:ABC transporter ATP-binding protein [Ornithobacterium rhinotracheale]AFL97769.1 ABC-type antimicrobial peptide transport system, ATPase component [Ornithobacterium rhinotracheale DSM 15997]AIP99606.1 phosphonate ABC transporter ATP-binding protein [Ornithobacterium rhinotracheale ORT-UMN 88]KGB66598.1 phosphonate ABC transporter ATP-binding protein [Ornithobacterium rhinotracheale H06-030791]MBN3662625.1 ABC transporter ATP-binding protein [Ornithobacterium rhinotracheale]MCK0193934.1 ABC t
MIQVQNLSKIYTTTEVQTAALNEVNLNIKQGEFVAIMGPSGCGKSTLLNVLGLLDTPTSGSYIFNEQETTKMNKSQKNDIRKKNLGFIFQNFNLIDELSVKENIELPLIYNHVPSRERKAKVTEIMEQIGIAHRANHLPQQLSGGQQQRVAVARALVNNPKLILADEPTGNLDSTHGADVMGLLAKLHIEGATIVMVTHSMHDARYASRVVQMKDGKIFNDEKVNAYLDSFEQAALENLSL